MNTAPTADPPKPLTPPATTRSLGESLRLAGPWMAGWLILMVVIAVAGRQALRELSVFQLMELRSLLGFLLLWPLLRAAGGLQAVRSQRLGQHAWRNAVHYAAQYAWMAALVMIPLAQVVAIEFTMPIWAAVLAVAFLGERMNRWKWLAIALGLVGVWIIMRPQGQTLDKGQWVALASSVGFAVSVVMVKSLTRTDAPIAVSFWMLVVQSLIGLVPALMNWQWPSAAVWGWVLLVAICGTYSHYCFAQALRHADATLLMPIDFLRVPLTAFAGWAIYNERVDSLTVAGMVLILLANVLNLKKGKA